MTTARANPHRRSGPDGLHPTRPGTPCTGVPGPGPDYILEQQLPRYARS